MKRYIDFVQKPKRGQTTKEEPTTFISVPEKKPAAPAIRRATIKSAANPTFAPKTAPATKPVSTPQPISVRPHYKPDFGPIRKKPLGAPVSHTATAAPRAASAPTQAPTVRIRKPVMDMTKPVRASVKPASTITTKPVVAPAARPTTKPPVEKPVENYDDMFDNLDDIDSLFGVIEDYQPVNAQPETKKRSLFRSMSRRDTEKPSKEEFDENPEGDLAGDDLETLIEKQAEAQNFQTQQERKEASERRSSKLNEFLKAGKSPFIRTASVEKRPLSNSVATRKPNLTKISKDEPSDPATIIEKPEKDAHVGIIVTVILTIVFGAAIGTAAFLLLPK